MFKYRPKINLSSISDKNFKVQFQKPNSNLIVKLSQKLFKV